MAIQTIVLAVGGPQSHEHVEVTAQTVWNIPHNLGRHPACTVIEAGSGDLIYGDVSLVDDNNLTITFSPAVAGTCYCN